ncbi:HAD family phosphatase [Candidatus Woesearchaeota archaeon]|nr:HAD family phosphatase [Candidatus Woesearchaeota archaeon]
MIKAIIFDYGGVLTVESSLRDFGEMYALKLKVDVESFCRLLKENWERAKVSEISSNLFWDNLSKFLNIDAKIFRKDFMEFFSLNKERLEFVRKLNGKYKLGLLSNTLEDWMEENIKKNKLNELFDVIATSYKSKIAKPNMVVYKEVVNKLGIGADECIYVDDQEKNIPPAKELGMKTILFKNLKQLKAELRSYGVEI